MSGRHRAVEGAGQAAPRPTARNVRWSARRVTLATSSPGASVSALPPSPTVVPDAEGRPAFGVYQGEVGSVQLARLSRPWAFPAWARRLRRKRWHYALYATHEVIAVMAVAGLGYVAHALFAAPAPPHQQPLVGLTLP